MNNQSGEQTRTEWRLPETLSPQWLEAGEAKALTGATVHVWRASLDLPAAALERCFSLLSAEERERAARFYRQTDRELFIAARGTLRILLSRYLNLAPESIALTYNPHGKPLLAEFSSENVGQASACSQWRQAEACPTFCGVVDDVNDSLHFNLTRRQALALYAFAPHSVGIDVELEQATLDFESLLPQVASVYEQALLRTLPAAERHRAFLHLWTRKEALLKAAGTGFAFPPAQFSVLTPSAELGRDLLPSFDVFAQWTAFVPESGFLATLAARVGDNVDWFEWREEPRP